ncbi:MAG: hypothetical protein IJQ62_06985 [Clostridia bacterium]|nr:hypothetical protein [Clostridia bacterium]
MQYLFTERAHLMCPHMCFGIVMAVKRVYEESRIKGAISQLSAAHPFLNALLGYEEKENAYYYRVTNQCKAALLPNDREISGVDAPEITEAYRILTERDWNLFEEGMLKIAVWRMNDRTCFLLVFHHLLADGRGALHLAEELADCYALGKKPDFAPEQLITAKDLPENSRMPFISRFLVDRANKAWRRENHTVSYAEYHAFADGFLKQDAVRYSVTRFDSEELKAIRQKCRENSVTVNDWLLAKMALEDRAEKIVAACDLRDRFGFYRKGALGNYSTAFSIEVKAKEKDLFALAKAAHEQVQKKISDPKALFLVLQCYASLNPGLLDAALIACRGGFPSKAGKFIGGMFFGFGAAAGHSVTNLGKIESESMEAAFFIPPASPAMGKTQGALTVNGVLTVCSCERTSA